MKKLKIELDDLNGKKRNWRENLLGLSEELQIEFDLYIDLVLIVYIFCAKFYFKVDMRMY